jgi:endonuclease YncB( thermonuclease family)
MLKENAKNKSNKVKRLLQAEDLKRGMFFVNNKLYGADSKGKINKADIILEDAKLVLATQRNGQIVSRNHVLRKYAETLKAPINFRNATTSPLMVLNGKGSILKQANSYLKLGMEIGYKTLDNPLQGFEEIVQGMGGELTGLTNSNFWRKAKALTNIQLGTGGVYNLSHKESLTRLVKNLGLKSLGMYAGYQALDSTVRTLAQPGSDFSHGLIAGIGGLYVQGRIGFAKVWSDRFQGYRQRQEQNAQGSTDLLTLAGMPLGGALVGAQIAYFSRITKSVTKGQAASAAKYSQEASSPLLAKIIGTVKPMTIMKRNTIIGGLIGAATVLPFLPGALVGASSKELEERYSGKKEQEVRANRWWLMGGGSIHGDHVKYFQQNWFARAKAESATKAIYGSDKEKKSFNPLLHPISYIRDPYRFEKSHDKDMPYSVWGMEVGYGSFVGKIFERTVGQIIKPDVLNPRIQAEQKLQDTYKKRLMNLNSVFGVDIDKDIIKYRNTNLDNNLTSESDFTESESRSLKSNETRYLSAQEKILLEQNSMKNLDKAKKLNLKDYTITVEDGDTLALLKKGDDKKISIRLSGLDAPEVKHKKEDGTKFHTGQARGQESKRLLEELIAANKELSLVVSTEDSSGKRAMGVIVGDNGKNINLEMIEKGGATALPWEGGSDLISRGSVNAAEKKARNAGRGLWTNKRYQAEEIFNELTGDTLTHNTFTDMKKLSASPVLAAYASFLKNIETDKDSSLSEKQIKTIHKLANSYLNFRDDTSARRDRQIGLGLGIGEGDKYATGISTKLKYLAKTRVSNGYKKETNPLFSDESPTFDPLKEAGRLATNSLSDFVGIKGWAAGMLLKGVIGEAESSKQLAKSGEVSNPSRNFKNLNLGDIVGVRRVST